MISRPANRRLGRVVSLTGAQLIALLSPDVEGQHAAQMGSLVKILLPHSQVFGIVGGSSIPLPAQDGQSKELKVAEIHLLGEVVDAVAGGRGRFRRGVSILPALDDEILTADDIDTATVYALPDQDSICVGTIHQNSAVGANVSINEMLGKHFAVLGTTGTGKSCALTLILKRILKTNPNAHVLLLDPHGEYARAFGDKAEHLTAGSLELPYWLFNFEEIVEVVFGTEAKDSAIEIQYLRELILAAKLRFPGNARDKSRMTVDVPVPYSLGDLHRLLDDAIGRLENRTDLGPYLRVKARLSSLQADRRFTFMFPSGLTVVDNLAQLVGRIFRVPVNGKPMSILDLAGVPSEVLNVVVSVLCRMAFDFALWSGQELPLLLVCEEAHRYAPVDTHLGFEPAKRALARIAKEGRKYGISLAVVSQRPSELDPSLLSQCSTVFALRMTSHKDQEIIQAALSETSATLLSALPLLGNAEALVIGEGVPVPMRLRFAELPPAEQPRSSSAPFSQRWQSDLGTQGQLERIVEWWRNQRQGDPPSASPPAEAPAAPAGQSQVSQVRSPLFTKAS